MRQCQSDGVGERLDWPLLALNIEGFYKPRNMDSLHRVQKLRVWSLPRASKNELALSHLDFSLVSPILDF